MSTTPFEQLGELYLESLCQDAYYGGAAGTIVDAVTTAAGCGGAPDGPDLIRAAAKLTRDAMGYLQRTIGQISTDWMEEGCDWARIDQFWDNGASKAEHPNGDYLAEGTEAEVEAAKAEAIWAHEQLKQLGERTWGTYRSYLPDGEKHNGGIHLDWIHDLALAATFLQAAAALVAEAFNLDTEAE